MNLKDNDTVLIRWIRNGAFLKDGRAFPRGPGDEDMYKWRDIKGVVTSGRCKVLAVNPTIPVIGDVH